MYETQEGLTSVTWKRETDLQRFPEYILSYWMPIPRQVQGANSKYRAIRRVQARRSFWRQRNKYYFGTGYALIPYSK